jgi:hypothetical protein
VRWAQRWRRPASAGALIRRRVQRERKPRLLGIVEPRRLRRHRGRSVLARLRRDRR